MESVVVLHGLWMPGWETKLLRRRLTNAGFATSQDSFTDWVDETLGGSALNKMMVGRP